MTIYKVYTDYHIEVKAKENGRYLSARILQQDAENTLIEQNGAGKATYTSNINEAYDLYEKEKAGFAKATYVSGAVPFYVFRGVMIDSAECDTDDEETLENMFWNGDQADIIAVAVEPVEENGGE